MTLLDSPPPATARAVDARTQERAPANPVAAAAGIAVTLLALLVLGFLLYVFVLSSVQEQHNQTQAYDRLHSTLGASTAPVGPARPGRPVALLDVPAMGLHHVVVVQGTDASSLMQGPGLRSDTPLPGEAGVSVIYGRRATFGAPFGRLGSLRVGDVITVTTGHGVSHYRVTMFSSHGQPVHDTTANRLVLVTANSSWDPQYSVTASAVLMGMPAPDQGPYPAVASSGKELATDTSVLTTLMLWCLVLVAVAAGGTVAAIRWARWPAWLLTAPVAVAVIWNVYENASHLLPNLL